MENEVMEVENTEVVETVSGTVESCKNEDVDTLGVAILGLAGAGVVGIGYAGYKLFNKVVKPGIYKLKDKFKKEDNIIEPDEDFDDEVETIKEEIKK